MASRKQLIRNAAECRKCNDVIESKHVHDFVRCSCGNLAVDGGLDYPRRVFNGPYKDLCEYLMVEKAGARA